MPRPERNDDDEEDLFGHFDNIDFFEEGVAVNDENAPPPSKPPAATPSSTTSLPNSRPLVPEDSIEIVSFNFSQSQARNKDKGKAKEQILRPSPPAATTIDKPTNLGLDPNDLKHFDEIDVERFTDPDFLRQQEEEMTRIAQSQAQNRLGAFANPPITQTVNLRKGKGKEGRIIKPLPKSKNPLFLKSQSRSPQPPGPSSSSSSQTNATTSKKEVIEVDSSSSASSSPKFVRARTFEGDGIEFIDDDISEEEDKENVPVMTRHVRRKTTNGESSDLVGGLFGRSQAMSAIRGTGTGDVIDLSD